MASSDGDQLKFTCASTLTNPDIHAVIMKCADFYVSDPDTCFLQVESQFGLHDIIIDETHFWHVMAVLNVEASVHAIHVVTSAPSGGKYLALQNFPVKAYSLFVGNMQRGSSRSVNMVIGSCLHLSANYSQPLETMDPTSFFSRFSFNVFLLTYKTGSLGAMRLTWNDSVSGHMRSCPTLLPGASCL